MEQLSAQDTLFLQLETNRTPMHIGGLHIYVPEDENKPFDFDEFKRFFQSRLHLSPIFRRRLVEVPLDLGRPVWIRDPDFHLDHHLFHVALPQPGGMRGLAKLAAQIYNTPLDRSRPLWSLTCISGLNGIEELPPNAFAVLAKIHHANIDGGSGAEIMGVIYDVTAKPREVPPPEEEWEPEEIPSSTDLITNSYKGILQTPMKLLSFIGETAGNALDISRELVDGLSSPPALPMTAPNSMLNVSVTQNKIFGAVDLPLKQLKKVRAAAEVKLNDVVLSICAGALRRYLLEKEELPDKALSAMVPISVRDEREKGQAGNKVSAMFIALATDIADPIERLKAIRSTTKSSKEIGRAISAEKLMDFLPSELSGLASRVYTRMGLSELHRPFYNLVITNVPGPPVPLYMNGARLVRHYGLGITMDGLGLMITVFSYAGLVSICATSCEEIMPDVYQFCSYIREELNELEQLLDG